MESNISGDIKKWRNKLGITQLELADKLKVNRKTIGEWENGEARPNKTSRNKLSYIFGAKVTLKGITEIHNTAMEVNKNSNDNDEPQISLPMRAWALLEKNLDRFDRNADLYEKLLDKSSDEKKELLQIVRNVTGNWIQSHEK